MRWGIPTALFVILMTAASAVATEDGYAVPKMESQFPMRAIGVIAICLLGIAVVALKKSKRSATKGGTA